MNYVFFDIECANCFQGRGKICSFGYVITDEFFNVLEKKDIVMNPHAKFHLFGHRNHPGIVLAYDEKIFKSSPSFPKYYEEIRSLLQDKNNLVFGFSRVRSIGRMLLLGAARKLEISVSVLPVFSVSVRYSKIKTTRSVARC